LAISKDLRRTQGKDSSQLRINTTLIGEPAIWFYEWKAKGIVRSAPDAVLLAFQVLREKILERELRESQLKTMNKFEE